MNIQLLKRLAWREKSTIGFQILAFALALSVFSVTLIFNLTSGVNKLLLNDAAALLGADLILESPDPISSKAESVAQEITLKHANLIEFFSMVVAGNDNMELATISAVQGRFPLQGNLVIENQQGALSIYGPPPKGEMWAEEGLLLRLKKNLNDHVQIGEKDFIISGIIRERPVATSDLSILAPLVYVNEIDLEAMNVLKPGNRATYRLLISGSEEQLKTFEEKLRAVLSHDVKWVTPASGRATVGRVLKFVQRYLSVILLIQVLLAGMAIAITSHHQSLRMQRDVALWRCLGASHRVIMLYHGLAYLCLSLLIILLSVGLAYWVTEYIAALAKQYGDYRFIHSWEGGAVGIGLGLILLVGFGLPPILALRQIAPQRILQTQAYLPLAVNIKWYILSILLIFLLFIKGIQNNDIALKLSAQIFVLSALSFGIIWGLWSLLEKVNQKGNLPWRLAVSYLIRYRGQAVIQCMVFTLVIGLLVLVYIFQSDFLKNWKAQLPQNTPNYFLLNVQPHELSQIQNWLREQNITNYEFYPIVRGRLTQVNSRSVDETGAQVQARGLYRPINLTWMKTLPKDNGVVKGIPWENVTSGSHSISVEKGFAERQKVSLGDTFTFDVGGQTITGKIVELRTVEWESFRPNFFVIFPPGVLENFAHSYFSSLYLPSSQKAVLTKLVHDYPGVSLLDIDALIEKVRNFTGKVALILTSLFGLVGLLGVLIMYASLLSTLQERIHESALLRVLGGKKALIRKIVWLEFTILGALSGVLGSAIAILLARYLAQQFFEVSFILQVKWIIIGLLGGMLVIPLFGIIGVRSVFTVSPIKLFRET